MDTTSPHRSWLEGGIAIWTVQRILARPGVIGIDFETFPTAPSWHIEQAVAEAPRGKKGEVRKAVTQWVAVNGQAKRRIACTLQIRHEDGEEAFCRLLEPFIELPQMFAHVAEGVTLVAHNAQFETEVLLKHGVALDIECTLLAAKALYLTAVPPNESQPQSFSLAALVEKEFGRTRDKTIRERDWRLEESLDRDAIEYGLQDVRDCLELWRHPEKGYRKQLIEEGLWEGYEVMARAILPTAAINLRGLYLDEAAHAKLIDHMRIQARELEHELDRLCDEVIDIHSAPQVSDWIMSTVLGDEISMADLSPEKRRDRHGHFTIALIAHTKAACKGWKTTEKTGYLAITKGTRLRMAEQLRTAFPKISAYLVAHERWRKSQKLLEAFGAPLKVFQDSNDNRVRGQFRLWAAWTGRQSCTDPNLQQQPNDPAYRAIWVAPPGRRFAIADYSQIELRLAAIESVDQRLLEVYRERRDVHTETVSIITGKPLDRIAWEKEHARETYFNDRKKGKGVNFLSVYGGGPAKLAETLGCSPLEAQIILARFFGAYPGLALYRRSAPEEAIKHGSIAIRPHRRVRYIDGTSLPTQAINAPIQGGAASVQMRALRLIYDGLRARPDLESFIAASVHDEFIIEVPDNERGQEAADLMVNCMARALTEIFPESEEMGISQLTQAALVSSWAEKP